MEQELNNYEVIETDLYHFKLIHKNQKLNLKDNKRFQDWKNKAIQYINKDNTYNTGECFLLYEFCDNCCSYSIFRMNRFSLIECLIVIIKYVLNVIKFLFLMKIIQLV